SFRSLSARRYSSRISPASVPPITTLSSVEPSLTWDMTPRPGYSATPSWKGLVLPFAMPCARSSRPARTYRHARWLEVAREAPIGRSCLQTFLGASFAVSRAVSSAPRSAPQSSDSRRRGFSQSFYVRDVVLRRHSDRGQLTKRHYMSGTNDSVDYSLPRRAFTILSDPRRSNRSPTAHRRSRSTMDCDAPVYVPPALPNFWLETSRRRPEVLWASRPGGLRVRAASAQDSANRARQRAMAEVYSALATAGQARRQGW